MSKREQDGRQERPGAEQAGAEPSLYGTFAAVLLLGIFLAGSWVAVFVLFLSRQ